MINFTHDEPTLSLVAQPVDQYGGAITNLNSPSWTVENEGLLVIQNQSGASVQFTHPDHTSIGSTRVIFTFTGGQLVVDINVTAGAFFGGSIVKV